MFLKVEFFYFKILGVSNGGIIGCRYLEKGWKIKTFTISSLKGRIQSCDLIADHVTINS